MVDYNEIIEINEINELNDEWINNFDKTDKLYEDFYKDDLYYVNLKILYIARNNEIEKIEQESFLMSKPNYISREEILELLKRSSIKDNRRYSLLSILRYNILLDADDIKNYLIKSADIDSNFLTTIKNIDAITFDKTINMFHDLNDIILIFYEKSNELKKVDPNRCTKKVYLQSFASRKKTIKKRYKD
jgi:hypothetical protein